MRVAAAPARTRGIPVVPVLLAGALAGTALGVGLSWARHRALELSTEDVEAQVAKAMPRATGEEVDTTMLAMTPEPELLRAFPSYPGSSPRRMFKEGLGPGSIFSVAWFVTFEPPADVVEYYYEQMKTNGLPAVSHMYSDTMGYAAWFDHAKTADGGTWLPDGGSLLGEGILYMASVVHEANQTYVFLSKTHPEDFLEASDRDVVGGIRLPPGGHPLVFNTGYEVQGVSTMRAEWPELPLASLVAALEAEYRTQGWKLGERAGERDSVAFVATRGGFTHSVAAHAYKNGSQVFITMEARQ